MSVTSSDITETLDHLLGRISEHDARLAETIARVERGWQTRDEADSRLTDIVCRALASCIDQDLFTVETMVTGFNAFSEEFFDRQMDAVRSGSYRATDYDAIRKAVYDNDEYMASTYYPALLLSYIASPNYRHILRSLDRTLQGWKARGVRNIVDIASGHGLLLLYSLKVIEGATGLSVDSSPVASRFSLSLQQATGWGSQRFSTATKDLLADAQDSTETFDAAICCELLEHIPNPGAVLERIRQSLVPGGAFFVSAAVRMESIDHLTYFATTDEVSRLLEAAGFKVLSEMSVPFVSARPATDHKWNRLVADSTTPVTYIAECEARGVGGV